MCGIDVLSLDSQSGTQVVVTAGTALSPGMGDVRIFSTSYGESIKSNAFTYLAANLTVLGTNGAGIASDDTASVVNGTRFRPVQTGLALTNTLSITNSGNDTLNIAGWTTNGADADSFRVVDMPTTIDVGAISNFTIVFDPSTPSFYTTAVEVVSSDLDSPFRLNLAGDCFELSADTGPYTGRQHHYPYQWNAGQRERHY